MDPRLAGPHQRPTGSGLEQDALKMRLSMMVISVMSTRMLSDMAQGSPRALSPCGHYSVIRMQIYGHTEHAGQHSCACQCSCRNTGSTIRIQ
jgi:hypothetical protein